MRDENLLNKVGDSGDDQACTTISVTQMCMTGSISGSVMFADDVC